MALSNRDRAFLRRQLFDALGSVDMTGDLAEHFDCFPDEIPDEAWKYLCDRERAIARLLSID